LKLVVLRFDGRLRQLSVRKADITVDVVSCLVASQFPEWSGLEIRPVARDGWDNALQRVNAAGGPPAGAHSFNRGGPVATWDKQTRATIAELGDEVDREGAMAVWEAALAADRNGRDVWVHGDVTGSNLLFRHDWLCGVIDFGCAAVGDPACDLAAAWTMFEGVSRQRFQSSVRADAGTWARARGWALWKALSQIPRRPPDDPAVTGARFGWRWNARGVIDQAITDLRSS
jgi:Phosphotransferase enzyme family